MQAQSFEAWQEDFGSRRAVILAWVAVIGHLTFVALDFVARPDLAMSFLPARVVIQVIFVAATAMAYAGWIRLVPLVIGTNLIGGVGYLCALAEGPLDWYIGGMYVAVIGATTLIPTFVRWHLGSQVLGFSIFVGAQLVHHPEIPLATTLQVTFILCWVAFLVNLSIYLFENQIREELKAKADLVVAYEKLAELDQAKTDFFANISHELRTPLTLILGTLRNLGQVGGTSDHQGKVDVGLRNGARLLTLINQLLDMSRIESGAMVLKPSSTDVATLVRQVLSSFDRSGTERRVELKLDDDELWAEVDAGLVRKLVFNLVSNAVKFTDAEAGWVRLTVARHGKGLRLTVEDNGPGVPVEMQERVFERFTQVDMSETRHHEGTGIGLALVKSVAELHGGTVELTSVPGQGACFVVTLPGVLTEQEPDGPPQTDEWLLDAAASAVSTAADRPRTSRPLVLVVDDNPDLREFVADLVYRLYDVAVASDGLDALGMVKELHPDLVLSDLMMPRMSGQDLLRAIRALDGELSRTPVILLTAKAQEEARISALDAGADDYLHKPFTDQELLMRVRNQLDRRRHAVELAARNHELSATLEEQVAELLRMGRVREFVPETLRRALAQEEEPRGFTRERLTCVFVDMVGYTALSERLEPEDLAELLNAYLRDVTAEAALHRGVVDKFIGDAVMVLYRSADHADTQAQVAAALATAEGVHQRVHALGRRWDTELAVRVGIETGMVTVGVFGSETLRSMTAVGNTINLAARLQSACPGGTTFVGPGAQRLGGLEVHEAVTLELKNIREPIVAAVVRGAAPWASTVGGPDHAG